MPISFYVTETTTRSLEGLAANFRAEDAVAQRQYRTAVRRHADVIVRLVQVYAPRRTGRMRRTVKAKFSPSGLISEQGWWADDYLPFGLPFYPPYQEFGTMRNRAQPSLYPATVEARPAFLEELRGITVRSVRRAASAARGRR